MAGGLIETSDDDDDDLGEHHEINVTPFIDVMLVLLIIFMVAAPLSTVDIPVELPVATATAQPKPTKPVFLTVKPNLELAVGEQSINRSGLAIALDAETAGKRDTRLFLRVDKSVPYGEVINVMNLLRATGYLKIALVGLEAVEAGLPPIPADTGARENR